jgi:tRNA-specific 2-thiouridylase
LEGKGYVNFFETQNINQKKDLFKEGNIIKYPENEIVGRHKGVIRYTKGQRRNIGVSFERPLYVMGVDKEMNEVIVCEEEFLYKTKFLIKNINLNSISIMGKDTLKLKIATRAIKKTINAEIKITNTNDNNISAVVTLENGERAITEGQACVFYNLENNRMLGGGIIETIY